MPLHNWSDETAWHELHGYWIPELAKSIKPQLPPGYRAHLRKPRGIALDSLKGHPDVHIQQSPHPTTSNGTLIPATSARAVVPELDMEVAVATPLEFAQSIWIEHRGWLVAAIELISPRNKDRHSAQEKYTAQYAGYLQIGVHLLLVDLLPKPATFSFADAIAAELEILDWTPRPSPFATSYRIAGTAAEGGSTLGRPVTNWTTTADDSSRSQSRSSGDGRSRIDLYVQTTRI